MWQAAVRGARTYPAFLVQEGPAWRELSWKEAGATVEEIAAGFVSLGIEKGDRVAIVGRTRVEWTLCDYALASIGVVSVPIYPTCSAIEAAYILGNSGARAVVCEDAEQYAKVAPVRAELEALDHVMTLEGAPGSAISLEELRERGRAHAAGHPGALDELRAAIGEDDLLTIIYTSGTTGPPKGCVITQRHYWVMVDMIRQVPGLFQGADRVLLYLPLAHNFARLVQYAGAGVGFTVAFCPDVGRVAEALLEVRPTIFPTVPRLFEKVHTSVLAAFEQAHGPKRQLVAWALAVGEQAGRRRLEGRRATAGLAVQRALADRLVFGRVKAKLGGELRVAVSGGAPLAKEVAEFFHSLGILILEGYGLTECTTASHVNWPSRYRFGTVGLPLPGVECRIAEDGEVLLRGENVFAGYYGDEKATRETLGEDGWLRTGDIGSIDADGFLVITDRKKDIVVTAGGKNVSPQNIENALKGSRFISQALVVGDRRPYLVALIVPDRDQAERVAGSSDQVRALVEQAVAEVNRSLGRVEQVKRFAVLDRDFSAEAGEVTPTLKLRRHVCEEHFRETIDALYAAPAPELETPETPWSTTSDA
jgi:long-chain acyl-CoA synthetase